MMGMAMPSVECGLLQHGDCRCVGCPCDCHQLTGVFAWAKQFEHVQCMHEERRDVYVGPKYHQALTRVCTVCDDVQQTACVKVWR